MIYMQNDEQLLKLKYGITILKYIYPVLFAFLSVGTTHTKRYVVAFAVEVVILFLFLNFIAKKSSVISWLVGVVVLFFIYAQSVVLNFAGSFLQLIMLTNLDSLDALRGKMAIYASGVLVSVLVLFLPVTYIPIGEKRKPTVRITAGILVVIIGVASIMYVGIQYSPSANVAFMIREACDRRATQDRIKNLSSKDIESPAELFYSTSIGDGIAKSKNLPEHPNVVLILTEGMSRNIMEDSRNIMPNVSKLADEGINFTNYYDHTAATYRGIIGTLYSSHQLNNGDTNNLVSVQSVLKRNGYGTIFVNSEPENVEFTTYLNSMGFDSVESGTIEDRSLTDGETYDLVFDSLKKGGADGTPQFVVTYTFGTHVSFDSPEETYGDGSDRLLNRFYNADYQFGQFLKKLEKSEFADNTVVVFTADHASYVDEDYTSTFYGVKERTDGFCDTIPFIIWYQGIEHEDIDASGRNSLALAPTILDYLDYDSENYFLGTSLYLPMRNTLMETTFCVPDSDYFLRTEGDMRSLTEEELKEYRSVLEKYLSLTIRIDVPIP